MRFAFLRPLSKERCEISHVERDDDPMLSCSEREHISIIDALEVAPFIEGEHVVALRPEPVSDRAARDVRIEEQAQRPTPGSPQFR